ncbi:CBS domain-containing protein [Streptomyces sp. NBC_01262]|uniref:CBS domain-containing protein n=1 Tax=Streptomyces sp. NBC_01262 TaxID=2903803 RepID=UPI002E374660|nr:CBS domain-containing protein [Streptomyces sp. NBC_01262]
MSDFERHSVGNDARHAMPGRPWRPDEEHRQDVLRRYLGAVAAVSSARAGEEPPQPRETTPTPGPEPKVPVPCVRDVMSVPAVSVSGETPFLEIAHILSREHLSAVPVVDAEDRVTGVVSESDLLARAALTAAPQHPGPIRRLREHRLFEKSRGETASTLMTTPAVTVRPSTTVADAAWLAARSRLKRLPVVDHRNRLVGVVSRIDLVRALVRDDTKIREEIESRIIRHDFLLDPSRFEVTVANGVVGLNGRLDSDLIPKLLAAIQDIDDVVDVNDHLIAA